MKMAKLILTLNLILICLQMAFSKAVDEHTVLLLNFDGDSLVIDQGVLKKVKDLSGNGNDAFVNTQGGEPAVNLTKKPSGPPKVVEGKFGNALYFDGTNFLEVPSSKTIEITDQITLEAWVKPEVLSMGEDNMTVLTKDCSYYMVLRENGHLATYFYGLNPPGYHLSKSTLKEGKWSHIAITADGSKVRLYINGKLDSEISSSGKISVSECGAPQSIGIGAEVRIPERGQPNHRYFKGCIDEIRVSDTARSEEEIKESFMHGLQVGIEPSDKLPLTWGRLKRRNER